MDFLEKDLEDIIFNQLQTEEGYDNLQERGLNINYSPDKFKCKRQLKIGNYGICDMVTFSRFDSIINQDGALCQPPIYIEVIELKRGEVNIETLLQAVRYLTGIKSYISKNYPKLVVDYSITLVGRTLNTGDWVYLIDLIDGLKVQTYSYGIDGINFKSHSEYKLTHHGLTRYKDLF